MNQSNICQYLVVLYKLHCCIRCRCSLVLFKNKQRENNFFDKKIIKGQYIIMYDGYKFILNKIHTGIYLSYKSSKIIANLSGVFLNYRYRTLVKDDQTIITIELTTVVNITQLSIFSKKYRKPFEINTRPAKMQKYKYKY